MNNKDTFSNSSKSLNFTYLAKKRIGLYSQGYFSTLTRKKFFKISILSKKEAKNGKRFSILLKNYSFNSEMEQLILQKVFGEFEVEAIIDSNNEESYLCHVSNIDYILTKILVGTESITGQEFYEVIL